MSQKNKTNKTNKSKTTKKVPLKYKAVYETYEGEEYEYFFVGDENTSATDKMLDWLYATPDWFQVSRTHGQVIFIPKQDVCKVTLTEVFVAAVEER